MPWEIVLTTECYSNAAQPTTRYSRYCKQHLGKESCNNSKVEADHSLGAILRLIFSRRGMQGNPFSLQAVNYGLNDGLVLPLELLAF